jgi:hypothetical protein
MKTPKKTNPRTRLPLTAQRVNFIFAAAIALVCAAVTVRADTFVISADAITDSSKPKRNFGTATDLELDGAKRVYLVFDLLAVPEDAVVKDAELRLWASRVKSPGQMWVFRVTSPWDESSLTDAAAPSLEGAPFAAVDVFTADEGGFIRIPVTHVVRDWHSGAAGNYGIALTADPSAGTPLNLALDSKENFKTAHEATLEVTLGFSDDDSDPENELNTDLLLDGTTLKVTDAGGTKAADLSSLDESAEIAGVESDLADHVAADGDLDPANEIQTLSLSGNTLSLSGSVGPVDLSSFLDNTDQQTLSISENTLSLTDGGSVDLSGYLDNTDSQDLGLSGNILSLSGSASTVNLSAYLDNTDQQALWLSGSILSLSNGGAVNLSGFLDNTDQQALSLSGNVLSLSNGGSVNLSGFLDNTDQQALTLSGNILSLSGGNSVDLSAFANAGDQGLASVLAVGNDGGGANMTNLGTVSAAALVGSAQVGDAAVQDASFTNANRVYLPNAGSRIWQSWTAESTGLLIQIDVHHDSNGIMDGSLKIYEGQGDSGTPILDDHIVNGGIGWVSYTLSTPVPVTEGQVYTMRLVDDVDAWRWRFNNGVSGDQYAGGRAHTRPIEDMTFRTYVIPNPTIHFSSGGIQVTAPYLKPTHDAGTDLGTPDNRWRNVYASNGVIQTSDARLKSDIEQSPYGLKEILALRPVAYRWKFQAGDRMLGFLAQDVESVVPEAVVGGPVQGQAYGMNYTELLPVVTRAIQEQQAQLEEQWKLIDEQRRLIQLQQEQIANLKAEFQQRGR